MSVLTLEAKLERVDPSTQWGFRMQGGQDFSSPLTIQRVLPGSLAAKCGLQQGDIILKIGNSDANLMKHKDAQGAIMGSGNKLDLLLQRKNMEQYMEEESASANQGSPPHQYQYEKFSTPTIPTKAGGISQYGDSPQQNYNTSARPFGGAPPPAPPPAPTYQTQVNAVTQQTQNLSFQPKPVAADFQSAAQRYAERDDKPSSATQQSKSFKTLQEAIDGGHDPPSALLPLQTTNTPVNRRSPSPLQMEAVTEGTSTLKSSHVTQFNSPAGLYTNDSINSAYRMQRTNGESSGKSSKEGKDFDDHGRKIYRPSETFKLVHEQDDPTPKQDENFKSNPSRTFQILQQQLEPGSSAPPQVPKAPPVVPPHSVPSWVPGISKRPDLPVEIAAERLSEVLQVAPRGFPQVQPLTSSVPERTQDVLSSQEASLPKEVSPQTVPVEQPSEPAPTQVEQAPPVEAPAPAPVPWASTAPKPAAPAAKPFVPNVPPPAPAAPVAPRSAPKPTGVGAVRGKKGDVTVYKEGQPVPGGARIPICSTCGQAIRGPFVVAMQKTWCPDHFTCAQPRCGVKLLDIGFVEEGGFLYCEKDYETYFAPKCAVCTQPIVGECVNALQKTYHPNCFTCHQCKQAIGGNQFHLEDGHAYCERDWKEMFQTMCKGCNFPIEPGDRWVEAMNSNYHSECFNCSTCQVSLEGQPFYAKAGKPYCKKHAR